MINDEIGTIGLCIDTYEDGAVSGRVFSVLHEEGISFTNAIQMIKIINYICDEVDRPQPTMATRSFNEPAPKAPHSDSPNRFTRMVKEYRGELASFAIKIRFRQNASWQGDLLWINEDKCEYFRSTYEMLMLLDSSLAIPNNK